ncbi:MAG TPA: hypothetical protein VJ521_10850, partial [Acidobacteriota bacterium]|nr:hypothetical protein [Acidobacteriota bacterium]
ILTLPGRLPSALTQRKGLARLVVKAIMSGQAASLPEGGDIRISQFDMAAIAKVDPQGRLEISKSDIERVTATRDREGLILGSRRGGAIVFILQSANEDRPLDYVFDTLSNSAKTQVSNSLPALFLVGFDGVEPGELVNIATQDFDPEQQPTALRIAVSKFLSSKDRDHIIGVTFLSRSALTPKLHGEFDSGGSAYIFPRRESRFWLEEFSGLFSTQSK